jgi:uncharacterized membrane protein
MVDLKQLKVTMRRVAPALVALTFALATPAEARLLVCNRSAHMTSVALGHFNGTDWMSEGWWTIAPKTCANLIRSPLDARYYYLYATDGAAGTWDGSKAFCTATRKFSIVGRARCTDRGFDRKGFFQIDTGEAPEWTQTLSD